jgi:hypothetical protein
MAASDRRVKIDRRREAMQLPAFPAASTPWEATHPRAVSAARFDPDDFACSRASVARCCPAGFSSALFLGRREEQIPAMPSGAEYNRKSVGTFCYRRRKQERKIQLCGFCFGKLLCVL